MTTPPLTQKSRDLAVIRRPCVHRGDKLRGGPCGQLLYPCGLHGGVCTPMKPCQETGRVCSQCDDYVPGEPVTQTAKPATRKPVPIKVVTPKVEQAPAKAETVTTHVPGVIMVGGAVYSHIPTIHPPIDSVRKQRPIRNNKE